MTLLSAARRSILAVALLAATCTAASATEDRRRIRIGTEGAYPPFNFLDSNRTLQGFEIDLARAVCEAEKVTCQFVAQDWEGLIPGLLAGKYDAIFASLSMTDERRKVIDFSARYYSTPALFVAPKDRALGDVSPAALSGKAVGAQVGTVSARYLENVYGPAGADIRLYVTQDEANLDLASGRLDAVLADKVVLLPWLEKSADGACCKVVGQDVSDPAYFGEGIGAGLRKGDHELKALIDRGIETVRASGAYDRINARYFPFSVY